jgi:hypothetical protein
VHAELRHTHINCAAAQVVRQDGANGAAAGHVIAHTKLLHRYASTSADLPAHADVSAGVMRVQRNVSSRSSKVQMS